MIDLQGVSKSFNKTSVVHEVTFSIAQGESVALVGPSGSGKTTILRLIAGFESPDNGRILLNGRLASGKEWIRPPHERDVGMVFQRPSLWPHMTVEQNVRFGLYRLKKPEADTRLREMLHITHLDGLEKRYPNQVSGGEAQRVVLARALAPLPAILLLDEPLSGLDAELNEEMIALIGDIRKKIGATIVYVTHDVSEAMKVTSRVVMLRRGSVMQVGAWDSVADAGSRK